MRSHSQLLAVVTLSLLAGSIACSTSAPGYGPMADLVIVGSGLGAEQRQAITELRLEVSGDEQYSGTTQTSWQNAEVHTRYVARRGTRMARFMVSASVNGTLVAQGMSEASFESDTVVKTVRVELAAMSVSFSDGGPADLALGDASFDAASMSGDGGSVADAGNDLASVDGGLVGYTCNVATCTCPTGATCSGSLPASPTVQCQTGSTCTGTGVALGTCDSGATCDLSAKQTGEVTCAVGSTLCTVRCPTASCTFHCPGTCKVFCKSNAMLTVSGVENVICN